ncbi:MAG: NAD kinase [Mangrovibacterium sp.]
MIVAIFGLEIKNQYMPVVNQLFQLMIDYSVGFYVHADFALKLEGKCPPMSSKLDTFRFESDLPSDVEFLITIGGDGTVLKSCMYMQSKTLPIIGVNTGHLGFLSAISTNELALAFDMLLAKQYTIEERVLLEFHEEQQKFGNYNYALNEVTVTKMDTSSMIKIHTYVDGEYLTSYWADGLIISTPTGSTAYSLSVGGPILPPGAQNFVITPICPHNLSMRPIVIPSSSKIELRIEGRGNQFLSSLDSRSEAIDFPGLIKIEQANFKVKTIKLDGRSFFDTLRNKLMWGSSMRS